MIICHRHKFIFIKCRKTAGTSIEIALSQFTSAYDTITPISKRDEVERTNLGYEGPQNYQIPYSYYTPKDWARLLLKQRKQSFYNHMPAVEIRKYVPASIWNTYFKFCFERNPFDKIVSHYYWAGGPEKFGSIQGYLDQKAYKELRSFDMYSFQNKVIVDRVYLFENLPTVLNELSEKLNLPHKINFPDYRAKSHTRQDKRHYSKIISQKERIRIEHIYARELTYFGYTF